MRSLSIAALGSCAVVPAAGIPCFGYVPGGSSPRKLASVQSQIQVRPRNIFTVVVEEEEEEEEAAAAAAAAEEEQE